MDIGAALAQVTIDVPRGFNKLKREPPAVQSTEPWIRKSADWHSGDTLCWVLAAEWCKAMSWRGKSVAAILSEGSQWLMVDVGRLLNRHYVAHLEKLSSWPSEWPFWAHGEEGTREYNRAKACAGKFTRH